MFCAGRRRQSNTQGKRSEDLLLRDVLHRRRRWPRVWRCGRATRQRECCRHPHCNAKEGTPISAPRAPCINAPRIHAPRAPCINAPRVPRINALRALRISVPNKRGEDHGEPRCSIAGGAEQATPARSPDGQDAAVPSLQALLHRASPGSHRPTARTPPLRWPGPAVAMARTPPFRHSRRSFIERLEALRESEGYTDVYVAPRRQAPEHLISSPPSAVSLLTRLSASPGRCPLRTMPPRIRPRANPALDSAPHAVDDARTLGEMSANLDETTRRGVHALADCGDRVLVEKRVVPEKQHHRVVGPRLSTTRGRLERHRWEGCSAANTPGLQHGELEEAPWRGAGFGEAAAPTTCFVSHRGR
jgi:hypothetical protein